VLEIAVARGKDSIFLASCVIFPTLTEKNKGAHFCRAASGREKIFTVLSSDSFVTRRF
jgi:hypothetical protein